MYNGYQVLRFENNYKSKDLYLIGNEMNNRVGTGNYDKERTKFNIKYKELEKDNLYQDVKYKLESRNIEYPHKTKTNLLNGVTISSGPEFFMTLGLPFKETDRKYKTGKKKGQNIWAPDIKSKDDIPEEVIKYFDESYNFLKELVGEENIVMAQVHFDEDTPHLQAYFLPVVNEVKRKCYQRDKDGNLIKEIKKDRNGKDKEVPILLRDKNGEIVYETVKGKFLNNDQFWKDLGGRNSFSKLQDRFNKYITSKGFNLDRGEIGANKYHQTKLEYHINELKAEEKKLNKDLNNYKDKINEAKNVLETSLKDTNSDLKKKIIGYSKKEVEKLMNDFDNLTRLNTIKTYESKDKDDKITSLSIENDFYKNNRKLIKSEKIRHEQYKELSNKDEELKYYKNAFSKLSRALDIITKRRPMPYVHNYVSFAESVMAGKRAREMDEEAQRELERRRYMAIRQVKSKYATKDGRTWVVDITYRNYLGRPRRYHSKKFTTRREAKDHEAEYKVNIKNMTEFTDLTFKQLIDEHYKYQQDKVKSTTLYNYRNMMPYLEPLFNIKVESFNIRHFELWRQSMNEKKISTRYKNSVYKYLILELNGMI